MHYEPHKVEEILYTEYKKVLKFTFKLKYITESTVLTRIYFKDKQQIILQGFYGPQPWSIFSWSPFSTDELRLYQIPIIHWIVYKRFLSKSKPRLAIDCLTRHFYGDVTSFDDKRICKKLGNMLAEKIRNEA